MKNLPSILVAAALLFIAAPDAIAQKKPDKVGGKGAAKAEEMRDRAEQKRASGDVMDEDAAEEARERAEEMREQAEERAEEGRERAEDLADDEDGMRGQDNAAARGNEKSQEMRARRDERKQIQEDYREGLEKDADKMDGDEMIAGDDSAPQKKAKKPWWKFWGD